MTHFTTDDPADRKTREAHPADAEVSEPDSARGESVSTATPRPEVHARPSTRIAPHPNQAASFTVEFYCDTLDGDPPAAGWIEPLLQRAGSLCGVRQGRLEVSLVDDTTMSELHAEHCGDSSTTDVLTFDLLDSANDLAEKQTPDPEKIGRIEADVILCVDEARRQAAQRGHDTRVELLLYAVHGLLHLLGEDDHDEAAYCRMHRREDELMSQLGVGRVFDRPAFDIDAPAHAPHGEDLP